MELVILHTNMFHQTACKKCTDDLCFPALSLQNTVWAGNRRGQRARTEKRNLVLVHSAIQTQNPLGNMNILAQGRCYPGTPPPSPHNSPNSSVNEANQCPFVPYQPSALLSFFCLPSLCIFCTVFHPACAHVHFLILSSTLNTEHSSSSFISFAHSVFQRQT